MTMINNIKEAVEFVAENAEHVFIQKNMISSTADKVIEQMKLKEYSTLTWRQHRLHPQDLTKSTVDWIFLMDLLNFSFWSSGTEIQTRYTVEYNGESYQGYWSLCAMIRRALDEGIPIIEPEVFANASDERLKYLFRASRSSIINHTAHTSSKNQEKCPLLELRIDVIKRAGNILCQKYNGSFVYMIKKANKSAQTLLQLIVTEFNDIFDDQHVYKSRKIPILKRAQILIADLWACFDGKGYGEFHDIDSITMFADYRVPQILCHLNLMTYSDTLITILKTHETYHKTNTESNSKDYDNLEKYIPSGHPLEIEIRACSIHVVALLVNEIQKKGFINVNAILVDFYLWDTAKCIEKTLDALIHRTRSIYY